MVGEVIGEWVCIFLATTGPQHFVSAFVLLSGVYTVRHRASRHPALSYVLMSCALWTPLRLLWAIVQLGLYCMSQRPTWVEVGPRMTTRFGEVRSGTAKGQELMI